MHWHLFPRRKGDTETGGPVWKLGSELVADEVLLIRPKRYTIMRLEREIPAGRVEGGETKEDAVRRECMEETGCMVKNFKVFLRQKRVSPGKKLLKRKGDSINDKRRWVAAGFAGICPMPAKTAVRVLLLSSVQTFGILST